MFENSLNLDTDSVIQMYVSGKTGHEIARILGVSPSYIYNMIKASGVKARSKRSPLDETLVISLYESGVSEKAISDRLGCSRSPIRRILTSNGIHIRSQSEAETVKWSTMTSEQRSAQVAAANEAVRNSPKEFHVANAIKQAQSKFRSLSKVGHLEAEFQSAFESRGYSPVPQYPFGPYNVDLAIGDAAIEIHGNSANPHTHPYYRKRVMELLESGWHVFYIKTTGQISIERAADQVSRMVDMAKRDNSGTRHYGMVRGSGELVTSGRLDGDKIATIDGPDGFFA